MDNIKQGIGFISVFSGAFILFTLFHYDPVLILAVCLIALGGAWSNG